jgi:multiple sugar transport system substrate-binding protein
MEWWDDVQPKAAVAANVGKGPDLIMSVIPIAQLYPDKCIEVKDVADYLGNKYGGWFPIAKKVGTWRGKWVALPIYLGGNAFNYRTDYLKAVGATKLPETTDELLEVSIELKKYGKPGGLALGHATGDANSWIHWLIWSFGGKLVDENEKVVINSPETIAALEYGKKLYNTFIEGTAAWQDGHNNKAFMSDQVSYTENAPSIYAKAKAENMPFADYIDHANHPVGPIGYATRPCDAFPMLIMKYTKYPNAAKAFMTYLMEKPQYDRSLTAGQAFFINSLRGYSNHPIWSDNPKYSVFAQIPESGLPYSHAGDIGYASTGCLTDFVIVDMAAEALTGKKSPKEAAERAEKRANRYYKV